MRALLIVTAILGSALCEVPRAAGRDTGARTPAADARARARTFLALLSDAQKATAVFSFTDSEQRARWSNSPEGGPTAARYIYGAVLNVDGGWLAL